MQQLKATAQMVCRFLDPQYRRPLILQELLGFHADIICLQEVDEKAFAEFFLPQLQQAGMNQPYTLQMLAHLTLTSPASGSNARFSGNSLEPRPATFSLLGSWLY